MQINKFRFRYHVIENKELSDLMLNRRFYSIIDTWENDNVVNIGEEGYEKEIIASIHYMAVHVKCNWLNKEYSLYIDEILDYANTNK